MKNYRKKNRRNSQQIYLKHFTSCCYTKHLQKMIKDFRLENTSVDLHVTLYMFLTIIIPVQYINIKLFHVFFSESSFI